MKYLDLTFMKETEEFSFENSSDDSHPFIQINRTNILVGPNNSRKSRFVRSLMSDRFLIVSDHRLDKMIYQLSDTIDLIYDYYEKKGQYIFQVSFATTKTLSELILQSINKPEFKMFVDYSVLNKIAKNDYSFDDLLVLKAKAKEILDKPSKECVTSFVEHYKKLHSIIRLIIAHDKFIKSSDFQFDFLSKVNIRINSNQQKTTSKDIPALLKDLENSFELFDKISIENRDISKKYISSLRGNIILKSNIDGIFQDIPSDTFKTTIRNNYPHIADDVSIITGLDFWNDILHARNSNKSNRKLFDDFQNFVANTFFEGKEIEIVSLIDEKSILVEIEGEPERKLHDLGDGIQTIMILMYSLFLSKPNDWIFIEEPELNLHPRLQHVFINTILRNKTLLDKNLTVFIVTHSNHIIGSILEDSSEVSIYTFEKKNTEQGSISKVKKNTVQDSSVLKLLGTRNTSVFTANCAIWVEGITDRRILVGLLKAYSENKDSNEKPFIEGYQYSFLEYAGSNLSHYLFDEPEDDIELEKINSFLLSNKIFLLSDKDNSPSKDKKHLELTEAAESNHDFMYQHTGALEIENVLPASELSFFLDNLKIELESDFVEADYENIGLGEFIETRMKIEKVKKLKAASGTLTTYYKHKLSEQFLKNVQDGKTKWSNIKMNKHAESLGRELYNFIALHNS